MSFGYINNHQLPRQQPQLPQQQPSATSAATTNYTSFHQPSTSAVHNKSYVFCNTQMFSASLETVCI